MPRTSMYAMLLSESKTFFKNLLGRFYFQAPQVYGIYFILPTLAVDVSTKEIVLCIGRWGLVFWVGKYDT